MINKITIKYSTDNMTPVVNDILKNLSGDSEKIIEFEKGTYYFCKDGSMEYPVFASSGRACNGQCKNVLFPVNEMKNVTIDGNGSEFVICDRVQPFMIQDSENIKFCNFSLDYSFLRYAYADVLNVTDEGVELFIDKSLSNYTISKEGNIDFICGKETLSTKTHKISFKHLDGTKSGICFLYIGDIDCELNAAATNVFLDAEETNTGVFLRYRKDSPKIDFVIEKGDRMCLAYDNDRDFQMFWFDKSKDVTIKNISVYRNGGMGVVADMCENVTLDGYNVCLKEGRDEYYSSTADAIFITNCYGDFVLKNSVIKDTYDDAINIHGYYTKVTEILDDKKIRISTIHPAHVGLVPVRANDTLVFNDPESGKTLFCTKVIDAWCSDDRRDIVVTLESTACVKCGMLIENTSLMPNVLIENNRIIRCPHMRLSAPNMIIRNNDLDLDGEDIYISDLWGFWCEYGAVKNVEITGNKFGMRAKENIDVESCRPDGHNHPHQNIIIKDNIFAKQKDDAIKICATENCIMENNKFGE